MAKFTVNGLELEADGGDLDFVAKFEKAVGNLQPLETIDPTGRTRFEILQEFETRLRIMFDELYGDGIWEKMFQGQKRSLARFIEAFNSLRAAFDDNSEIEAELAELKAYLPSQT